MKTWLLKKICKWIVARRPHKYLIQEYYKIMWDAARNEFTEDNTATLKSYLQECFDEAIVKDLY